MKKNGLFALCCIGSLFFVNLGYGRWPSMDRYAEKYYNISPYAYAANNPVGNIDINGDSISFSYQYDANQQLSGITLNYQGKIINQSRTNVDMSAAAERISSQMQSTFSGKMDNGVTFNTMVNLGVANSMNDVRSSDHLITLVDRIQYGDKSANGATNYSGGKVAFIDAGYFSGPWDITIGNVGQRTAVHEIGHQLGLSHYSNSNNIMTQGSGNSWYVGATGFTGTQRQAAINNYNNGILNQGANYEIISVISPSSPTGVVYNRVPNRGLFYNNINF